MMSILLPTTSIDYSDEDGAEEGSGERDESGTEQQNDNTKRSGGRNRSLCQSLELHLVSKWAARVSVFTRTVRRGMSEWEDALMILTSASSGCCSRRPLCLTPMTLLSGTSPSPFLSFFPSSEGTHFPNTSPGNEREGKR